MAKKDEIIEAALDIICQDGVRSLTLPALFQKARTGAGTFYHYFSGREELIEAVFDVCCAVAVDELTSFKQLEGSAESRFGALCQRCCSSICTDTAMCGGSIKAKARAAFLPFR